MIALAERAALGSGAQVDFNFFVLLDGIKRAASDAVFLGLVHGAGPVDLLSCKPVERIGISHCVPHIRRAHRHATLRAPTVALGGIMAKHR